MKIKKTWFSYLLWGLFSVIMFACVGFSALSTMQGQTILDYIPPLGIYYGIFIAGTVLTTVLLYVYCKYLRSKLKTSEESLRAVPTGLFFAIFCVIGLSIRIVTLVASYNGFRGDTSYYDVATNAILFSDLSSITNLGRVYIEILHFIFQFIGNKFFAGLILQLIIQFATMFFLFFSLKNLLNKVVAWVALLLYCFLPGSFMGVTYLTPDCILAFFICAELFFLSLLLSFNANDSNKTLNVPGYIISYLAFGLFSGLILYLDILGSVLILIAILSFILLRKKEPESNIEKPLLQILIFISGCVLSFMAFIFLESVIDKKTFMDTLSAFGSNFIPADGFNLTLLCPHYGFYDVLVLYVLSGSWFVTFMKSRLDKAFPYVMLIVFSVIFKFFSLNTGDYQAVISFCWIVVSAIGATNIHAFWGDMQTEANVSETVSDKNRMKSNMSKQKASNASDLGVKSQPDRTNEDSLPQLRTYVKADSNQKSENTVNNNSGKTVSANRNLDIHADTNTNNSDTGDKQPVEKKLPDPPQSFARPRMLKNPLPGPKPHVPKEMNYDYFPKANEMDYDIKDMRGKEYYDI